MSDATFDLSYTINQGVRMMSCAVSDSVGKHHIGPFAASVAGPQIVAALMNFPELGFATTKEAETAYIMAHFLNMSLKLNNAGMAYPSVREKKT